MGKRSTTLALTLLLVPAAVWADRHKAGLKAAYAKADRSDLQGMQIGGEWELHDDEPTAKPYTFSVVGDLTLVNGPHTEEGTLTEFTLSQFTLLVGPRVTWGHGFVQPFLQALAGFGRLNEGEIRTPPALAFGAGVDVPLTSSKDGKHPRLALRLQGDQYYLRAQPTDWFFQWSLGLVVRFNR
jgi:hypothetical protein